ncbi:MAG: RNA polymerase sigma factor [Paracoccaceae bacterium]
MSRAGPDAEFRQALIREAPYLRRFARALLRDAALSDDLVQDTLERAISRHQQFDKSRAMRPWLLRMLRNLAISQFRASARHGVALHLDTVDETGIAPTPDASPVLMLRDISSALQALPLEQREVLVLVALEGMKYREVVDVLNVPIGTVMSRLSRARERLRELLQYPETKSIRRIK